MSQAHSVRQLLGDSGAEVAPGLLIGDKRLASNLDALQSLGVTHVVNATVDVRNYFEQYDERQGHLKMEYLRCPCHDTDQADMSQHFLTASEFIERALAEGHSVLVHCQQGISRSSTLLIAFLMHSRRMGLAEAYTLVRSARMVAKPKANFLRQLVKFGNELEAARLHKQNLAEAQSVKAAVQQNVKALEEARSATAVSPSAEAGVAAAAAGSASPAAAAAAPAAAASAASPPTASPTAGTHSPLEAVDVAPGLFIMNPAAAAPSTSSPPNPVDATEGPRRERALKQMQQRTHSEAAAVKRKQSNMDVQVETAPAAAVAGTGVGTGTSAADGSSGGSDSDSAMGEREAANNQKRRRIIKHAEATAVNVAAEAQLQHDEAARTASESPPIIAPLTQLNLDRLA